MREITPVFDLDTMFGRAQLILALTKLYALLVGMARAVPVAERYPLFSVMGRPGGSTLQFLADSVVKEIPNFCEFCVRHGTTLPTLQAAYRAAGEATAQAVRGQRPPALVCALQQPAVSGRGTYRVTTGPLGYASAPTTEQVCGKPVCTLSQHQV